MGSGALAHAIPIVSKRAFRPLKQTDLDLAASSVSTASEAARRYAGALFDLAKDKGELASVAADLKTLEGMAADSDELSGVLASPAIARDVKVAALVALAKKAGLGKAVTGFAGTMAENGRANELISASRAFDVMYADHRGVKRATATTATEMTADQRKRLEKVLADAVGSDVELTAKVDPTIVGGIQLRIGSTLIDASVASKLERMNTAMKGA